MNFKDYYEPCQAETSIQILLKYPFLHSLRRGPGSNVQDNSGYSALHHATLNGHVYVLLAFEK